MKRTKNISIIAQNKLKVLDADTLVAFTEIRGKMKYHQAFLNVVRSLIDEEVDVMASLDSADPNLATKHANAKGRAGALTIFMHMLEGSMTELERRDGDV